MVLLAYSGAISQESSILMDELKSKRDWGKWASPSIKWEHQEGTIFEAGCLTRHRISWHCGLGLPRTMSDIFLVFVSSLWLWSSVISAQMGQDSAKKAQWTWVLTEGTVLWGWYLMGRKMHRPHWRLLQLRTGTAGRNLNLNVTSLLSFLSEWHCKQPCLFINHLFKEWHEPPR